ncbi:MAG: type II secretion system minor pseudopilin GspK [Gammaproteobacteria bacterium]
MNSRAIPDPTLRTRRRERGIALLIALLILALGASIASAMLWERNLAVSRTSLLSAQSQAWLYDLGVESWVEQILLRDAGKPDTLSSDWATQLPPLPVEGGAIQGKVEDLQGRFNLNDLVDKNGKENTVAFSVLQHLFTVLNIDPGLANAVLDWVDADDIPRETDGAETGYYSSLDPPYASANALFVSATSLLLVKGITPEIYARLAPYVTALPVNTPVNVNTTSAPVLAAIVPDLSLEEARSVIQERGTKGFENPQQVDTMVQHKIVFPFSLNSSFFLLHVTTTIGNIPMSLYSILYRNQQGMTETIARSFTPF